MKTLERLVDTLNRVVAAVCHLILIVIVCVIVGQVFLRFVMRSPTSWSEELALLLLIWYGMLAVGVAVGRHGHIAIMTLRNLLPERGAYAIDLTAQLLILVFAGVVFWNSFDLVALAGRQLMPALGISREWLYYPAVAGSALIALNAIFNIVAGRLSAPDPETMA